MLQFRMLLGNILFLTGRGTTPSCAGLAVTPARSWWRSSPDRPADRDRAGFRPVLRPAPPASLRPRRYVTGDAPAYLTDWLGTLIVGLGIGLTFPVLSAAAVSSLPAHRYGRQRG
jgi:hypothetical protein